MHLYSLLPGAVSALLLSCACFLFFFGRHRSSRVQLWLQPDAASQRADLHPAEAGDDRTAASVSERTCRITGRSVTAINRRHISAFCPVEHMRSFHYANGCSARASAASPPAGVTPAARSFHVLLCSTDQLSAGDCCRSCWGQITGEHVQFTVICWGFLSGMKVESTF